MHDRFQCYLTLKAKNPCIATSNRWLQVMSTKQELSSRYTYQPQTDNDKPLTK